MKILISPLNWGIGHATRIVPIINELKKIHTVIIAADGLAYNFLKCEFENLQILKAPTLTIKYQKKRSLFLLKMSLSIPKLIKHYFENKNWVKKHTEKLKIDVIIADNRFGFFSKKIKSIIITHQLNIIIKNKILRKIIFLINKINIQKFDECWIPDLKNKKTISGYLSSTKNINIKSTKIGLLSRFPIKNDNKIKLKYNIVAILSGPEPQRTILEKILIEKLQNYKDNALIIRGLPGKINKDVKKNKLKITNHLSSKQMQEAITQADIVICRAGYSSIMDLIMLGKTALLIPTPGQTEQEYLANHLYLNKLFWKTSQNKFNINHVENYRKKTHEMHKNIKNLKKTKKLYLPL